MISPTDFAEVGASHDNMATYEQEEDVYGVEIISVKTMWLRLFSTPNKAAQRRVRERVFSMLAQKKSNAE
jgi:hypothetical protein